MAYLTKTFRKSGSHHAESSAIDGVEMKIGEKFRPPKKVTLPVGWHQHDPSDVLSLTYDYTLEKEVLRKAEEEKNRRKEESAAIAEAAMATNTQTVPDESTIPPSESASKPNPVFTNMGMDILTPVTVSGSGHKRVNSLDSKGKNAFEMSDFEGEALTPFELVELQTINDMDVLKTVLATTMGDGSPQPSSNSFTVTAPSSGAVVMSSASAAGSEHIDNSSDNDLVNISSNTTANCNSTVAQSANTDMGKTSCSSGTTLVDISEPSRDIVNPKEPSLPVHSNPGLACSSVQTSIPLPHTAKPVAPQNQAFTTLQPPGHVTQNPSLVGIQQQNQPPHSAPVFTSAARESGLTSQTSLAPGDQTGTCGTKLHLPPLRSPPQIPPRPWITQAASRASNMISGVHVMPSNSGLLPYPSNSSSSPLPKRGPTTSPKPAEPSLPKPGVPSQHPSLLPPIRTPETRDDSTLPDPWPVLSESERALVSSIASMGFPAPRVARAVQRLGAKDREIVDFLFLVDEVSQLGHPPDSAEVALTLNSMDKEKALTFLELEKTFKEWGFKQDNIQEALRAADNDRDKALDYLMTLQSPA